MVHWRKEWQTTSAKICLENPMNSMKRQKDKTLKEELPNISGEITSEKKKDGMEPKQKQHPVVDVIGDRSKVRCCKSNIT